MLPRTDWALFATLLREYPILTLDVHNETGGADWASQPLADYYKMDRTRHVQAIK